MSALALGTVSLGLDYGIGAPGEFGRPSEDDAVRLIHAAVDRGVTLIDTAPAYGSSERLVGRAVGRDTRVLIATKVAPHDVESSIEASRRALDRDLLDIVQLHNATPEMLLDGRTVEGLLDARHRGRVRLVGASVYGEAAALAALQSGAFDVLQVAFNALDQRMAREVLPAADAAGVGIIARSAVLKGVLTKKASWLPDTLAPLRDAATHARDTIAGGSWEQLPIAALRFCLSSRHVASVLCGPRTMAELEAALAAEAAGPLDAESLAGVSRLAITDDRLLDPRTWRLP